MSKITIREIAKKCNVSTSTVSRAINNHPEINPETRQAILKIIESTGYTPNINAQTLKCLKTNTIAVLIKGIDNPFLHPMFKILEQEITCNGYSFLLHKVEENGNEVEVALRLVKNEKPKGIIFLGGCFIDENHLLKLKKLELPFAVVTLLSRSSQPPQSAYIGIDDLAESKKIVNYLIGLGHKKIAVIGARHDDKSIGCLRIQGYKDALTENKLKIDEHLILTGTDTGDPYTFEYGYNMAELFFSKKIDCSAIYCVSDAIAIGFLKKMREKGLRCPDDYTIAGFDGLKINEFLSQSLTTIKQPVEEMASRACTELFHIIDNLPYEKNIIFKGKLWIGQTTATPFQS